MLLALGAFLTAIALALVFLPLWPFGIAAYLDWIKTPPAPDPVIA